MKSISILSLALLVGLGLSATAVQAWGTPDTCGASTFPATGQTTSHPPILKTTDAPVRDDGVVRAGGALSYQNNGDGTITDLNTGLMWEQKIRNVGGAGLHDVSRTFPWDAAMGTIWDWLEEVNTEGGTGLGGFNDWRIPNVKELESIVDYGTSSPPLVDPAFNNGPGIGPCTVAECSLTASNFYWSSTTNEASPTSAREVNFTFGVTTFFTKTGAGDSVRAVRGGCVPG